MSLPTSKKLLAWYDRIRRDLPWRRTSDPYAIWLSEVMLQQTTVETVIPYYERFIQRYPTPCRVAAAPIDDLISLWAGLGYYNRIRNFQRACQIVCEDLQGQIPRTKLELKALPGIGDYTASAVASIAFNEPSVVVDGNVLRVMARITACQESIKRPIIKQKLEGYAQTLLDHRRAGDFNQALMELGALLCTPNNPQCPHCPWQSSCTAHGMGIAHSLPNRGPRASYQHVSLKAYLWWRRGSILIRQRGLKEILAGMWEVPFEGFIAPDQMPHRFMGQLHGLMRLGGFRHGIMNQRYQVEVFSLSSRSNDQLKPLGPWQWVRQATLQDLPLTTMTQKALRLDGAPKPDILKGT